MSFDIVVFMLKKQITKTLVNMDIVSNSQLVIEVIVMIPLKFFEVVTSCKTMISIYFYLILMEYLGRTENRAYEEE